MNNQNYRLKAYEAAVEDVSELWVSFETIPVDESSDCIKEPWNGFEVGTPCAKIYSWFAGAYGAWINDPLLVGDVPGLKQEDLPAAHLLWDKYCNVDTDAVMHPESKPAAKHLRYLYLAITYYSFDSEVRVAPFATREEACAYINELADEELRIDTEENGWNTELVNRPGKVQVITHFAQQEDVVTYQVASIPVKDVQAVLDAIKMMR